MAKKIEIRLDGEGDEIEMVITGCPCHTLDFSMALVKFANEWREARAPKTVTTTKPGPCGCTDAK